MDSDAGGGRTVAREAARQFAMWLRKDNAETQRAQRCAEDWWSVGRVASEKSGQSGGIRPRFEWGRFRTLSKLREWSFCMDNLEEIGRRIDAEMERLRR